MKFLFVTRFFSGLIQSIENKKWDPSGIPAIYKLLEQINKNKTIFTEVLFLCKTKTESQNFRKITKIILSELDINFYVVPFYGFNIKNNTLSYIINDTVQLLYFIYRLVRFDYDLLYTDRININFAFIGSLFKIPTVIRFLGIANLKLLINSVKHKLLSPLNYLCLKRKYDLVICSEDGSPARYFFEKCLNKKTPYIILLNGVEKTICNESISIREKYHFVKNYPVFLFIGRNSNNKGVDEIIQTLIKLKSHSMFFYAIIICGGSDYKQIRNTIAEHSLSEYVRFVKFVPHKQISEFYKQADIFISLNKYGNLSNAVLEAMNEGTCVIMLGKDENDHTDESTEQLVPADVAIRIDRKNIVDELTNKLECFIFHPEKILTYSKRVKNYSKKLLWPWDERIEYEIAMLERVAKGEALGQGDLGISEKYITKR